MAEKNEKVDTAALASRVAELEALVAKLTAPAARRPEPGEVTPEDRERHEWLQKPLEERAQHAADQMFQGPRVFECYLLNEDKSPPVVMKDCPVLTIAANSPEEAVARYQKINGIRHTERRIEAKEVGKRPAA